jgi:hypothetical protein
VAATHIELSTCVDGYGTQVAAQLLRLVRTGGVPRRTAAECVGRAHEFLTVRIIAARATITLAAVAAHVYRLTDIVLTDVGGTHVVVLDAIRIRAAFALAGNTRTAVVFVRR